MDRATNRIICGAISMRFRKRHERDTKDGENFMTGHIDQWVEIIKIRGDVFICRFKSSHCHDYIIYNKMNKISIDGYGYTSEYETETIRGTSVYTKYMNVE